MTVWCGQCQTRNDGEADWCTECGAPLRPNARVVLDQWPSKDGVATALKTSAAGQAGMQRYDPRWLMEIVAEQCPDRPDLYALVAKCRTALRSETALGGGRRTYFLPERSGAYSAESEDTCTLAGSGQTVVLALVRDTRHTGRKAVYYVETRPEPIAAPTEAKLAQYRELWQERRALGLQIWLVPTIATIVAVLLALLGGLGSVLNPGGAGVAPSGMQIQSMLLFSAAASLSVYTAVHVHRVGQLLDDRAAAIGQIEAMLGLVQLAEGRGMRRGATALPPGTMVGLMVGLSVVMLWLTARTIIPGAGMMPRWEPPVVVTLALLAYPAWVLAARGREWWALRAASRELERCLREGQECSFEPWAEASQ